MHKASLYSATNTHATGRLHWWLLLAALVVVLFSLNLNSVGVTRGGDEDEGSGIGGTGRQALPGSESGLGGTGLRPFISVNTRQEVEAAQRPRHDIIPVIDPQALDIPPVQPMTSAPMEAPATVALDAWRTRDSGAIDIAEHIQRDIDSNALTFQRLRTGEGSGWYPEKEPALFAAAAQDPFDSGALRAEAAPRADSVAVEGDEAVATHAMTPSAESATENTVSWDELAGYLAETAGRDADKQDIASGEADARRTRPERLQRPELPPVQRVRPIQRAAVLPPRIKPLAL